LRVAPYDHPSHQRPLSDARRTPRGRDGLRGQFLLAGCAQFTLWLPAAPVYSDVVAFAGVLAVRPLARGRYAVKMEYAALSLRRVCAVREARAAAGLWRSGRGG